MSASSTLLDTALRYHRAGQIVLPNDPAAKFPTGLRAWQTITPTEAQIRSWYRNGDKAIGLRDVEGLDFDNKGHPSADELYTEWYALCDQLAPGLAGRLLLEKTPSGGYHTAWRCEVISGNQKLATRPPTPTEQAQDAKAVSVTLIETRGKGGQFQVAPSPGYTLVRGDWAALPQVTPAERQIILDSARALSRSDRRTIERAQRSVGDRPGDVYNRENGADALRLLEQAGWSEVRAAGETLYLCRPGKVGGVSASFGHVAPGVLYVFSSNASPFEPNRAYGPFAVYTELQHNGDYSAAARALRGEQVPAEEVKPRVPSVNPSTGEISEPTSYSTVPSMPMDANDLLAMERKPVVWFAPGFLREGLGILVGQPNVGKTPLLIQMAIAMAMGTKWMNAVECKPCKVLFLGVEYTRQEIAPLLDISRCGVVIPRGQLLIKTMEDDFPTTPDQALADLEWYIRVLGVEVIIIDVMTAFLPPEKFKQNVYRGDYAELKPYHKLASMHSVAILGSWHASKREADPKIMYNGSTGMWAVPASRITMYTDQEQRVRVASFPRMADKTDWALTQERMLTGRRWIVADVDPEPAMNSTETQIYRFLKEHATNATPLGPSTIAEMTGLPINTIKVTIRRMYDKNLVQQSGNSGYFVVTSVTDVTDVTPVTIVTGYKVTKEKPIVTDFVTIDSEQQDAVNEAQKNEGYKGYKVTPGSDPFWHVFPKTIRMTTRMMLLSDAERNVQIAQERCEQYGVDFEEARRIAREEARNGA